MGVGGYLLQGGISFLSAQYGLAADVSIAGFDQDVELIKTQSIVGWEVVNHEGDVVNVSLDDDPELAVAMRGSGSQFGLAPCPSSCGSYR